MDNEELQNAGGPIDPKDTELLAQAMVAQRMVVELLEVKKLHNVHPGFFAESWLKTHVYDASDVFLYGIKDLFSKMYIDMVKEVGVPVKDWRKDG